VVSLGSKRREGIERSRRASSAADKNVEGEKVAFNDFLDDRFAQGSQYADRCNVVQHMFKDFAGNMVNERSKDTAKFPSGEQGSQDIGVILLTTATTGLGPYC
jgi:hypothetical protein